MAPIAMGAGILLIVVGLAGFYGTGAEHKTALIPAAVGVVMAILGALAFKEAYRKHAMHAAAALGVLGILGTAKGLVDFAKMKSGIEVGNPAAIYAKSLMALICIVFVALCVNSFIAARRRRVQANPAPTDAAK
jgi:mannose/fructose/N-acetylgalactosamine-specific phosphotransferase system component IIC